MRWLISIKEEEICALQNVFPETFVLPRDFYREQPWIRWMSKADHGISIYAEEVKFRLRRIANSLNKEELRTALAVFYNWEKYTERLGSERLGFQK